MTIAVADSMKSPIFSGGRIVISFLSLGGMRQFSQGLYGMSRSFTAWTTPHEGVGQGLVVLFRPTGHPAVFFQVVIHSLDVDGRELLELDRADGRDDVVFNDPLIALGSDVADVGLAVGFKPQAAPLRCGVVARVIKRHAAILPNGFRQLFFALRLGLGGHAFGDSPASDRVDALGISALPAAAELFTDAALAVGLFLCHL